MKQRDRRSIINVYSQLLGSYGAGNPLALGWSAKETQEKRFAVLCAIAPLHGCSLLDLGCGLGDLYGYLAKKGWSVDYCGLDLCPRMLAEARRLLPSLSFLEGDLTAPPAGKQYDYVFVSGAFNWAISDNEDFARRGLAAAWRACRRGVAANFLSNRDPGPVNYLHYFDAAGLREYAKGLAPRVVLREDYGLYDFTLYLYKE